MVQAIQNPQRAIIGQMSQSNPQIQQVMQFINQNGGDAKSAFYALAKQKNADPDMILNQARQMMGNMQR